ncbi:uncharacterized protein LOC110249792 isoform X1 [Exaiptasia diaphana]|uniref:Smr domain-containing protein n=1 Tax=Exaiptasia diaphana TaxID=2652724 RepID=A0A913YUE5_EXADI|nr:uncharacterized protein LOC110249792 isoform X1 [Exaiptasia diaphana]
MPYHYSKLDRNAFEFKFNCVSSNMESREHIDSSEPNVTYFKPCVNIEEDTVSCFLEVFYKGKLLGSPLQLDVIQILPYREDDYLSDVEDPKTVLDMYNMTKAKVIGEDYSNLDNVNRILWRNYDKGIARSEIVTMDDHRRVSVNITMFEPTQRVFVRRVFSNVIKGLHYRNQASKFNKQREDWKTKSIEAYRNNSYEDAKEYSEIKDKFGELMNTSNWRASYAVFEFFNHGRQANEIDLHGQLVADEAKLNSHKMQLLEKRNEDEVQKIINTERDEMDEAIRHLRDKIDQVKDNADWLEIIVGAGHHSRAQLQKISPKVKKFLAEMGWEYELCNKGSLLITFREYNGKQPCRATFYCSECDKTWVSNSSWKGKWQKCFRCDKKGIDSKCNPLKLGCREQSRAQRRRTTNEWNSFTQEDHRRLCQVCIEKGEDCRTV